MIRREAIIFLFVGSATVVTDLAVYDLLLWSEVVDTHLAKGISFVMGLLLSYTANRTLTFGHANHKPGSLGRYLFVYAITLAVNVVVNAVMLTILAQMSSALVFAFIVATGASATLNFLGMKFFVFRAVRIGRKG